MRRLLISWAPNFQIKRVPPAGRNPSAMPQAKSKAVLQAADSNCYPRPERISYRFQKNGRFIARLAEGSILKQVPGGAQTAVFAAGAKSQTLIF